MPDRMHAFHVADYILFGATMAISIGIGIYFALSGGRQRSTSEYLVAGRSLGFLPVAISLMVSFESSIMMLGIPAEAYVYGYQFWIGSFGFFVAQMLANFIMVPLLHPLKITSAYEYLELRFKSRAVRLMGTFMGIVSYLFYMGTVLFGPAIALEAVTGFPQFGSIFLVAVAAIIYTAIGGLKAVIWTDVFQAVIMFTGLFSVLIKGSIDGGGVIAVWTRAKNAGRINIFNFDPDPTVRHTFWNLFFGKLFRGLSLNLNQSSVQRIASTKSIKDARFMMFFMAPAFFISLSLALMEGIVAYGYYDNIRCDPLASEQITDPNQIIPFMVMDIFKNLPGMPGLFLASLFSASLSTVSSGLSSLSALTWTDIMQPILPNLSDSKATIIAKVAVVIYGFLACGMAFLVSKIGGTLTQINSVLLAAFGGPLTGIFSLAIFCPIANAKGTLIGGIVGLLFGCWLSIGSSFSSSIHPLPYLPPAPTDNCPHYNTTTGLPRNLNNATYLNGVYVTEGTTYVISDAPYVEPEGIEKAYLLSYTLYSIFGTLCVIIVGVLASIATGCNKNDKVPAMYLAAMGNHLCCCLPRRIRNLCNYEDEMSSHTEIPTPITLASVALWLSLYIVLRQEPSEDVYDLEKEIKEPDTNNHLLFNGTMTGKTLSSSDSNLKKPSLANNTGSLVDIEQIIRTASEEIIAVTT